MVQQHHLHVNHIVHPLGFMGMALSQPPLGYVLLLVQATCNNFAAVFTERMLKSTPGSLNWQNLQMYTYGIVISFIALTARGIPITRWFEHYNEYTWGLVVLGGFTVRISIFFFSLSVYRYTMFSLSLSLSVCPSLTLALFFFALEDSPALSLRDGITKFHPLCTGTLCSLSLSPSSSSRVLYTIRKTF